MVFAYMQVPTLLGVGRINVTLELPAAGGLYQLLQRDLPRCADRQGHRGRADARTVPKATLSLDTSPKIPADLQAEVRSVSAVGEQYVDLRPRTDSGPYLQDGSVIAGRQHHDSAAGRADARSSSARWSKAFPKDRISDLLDESFKAFNGAGPDFRSLLDSAAKLTTDLNGVADQTRAPDRRQRAAAGFAGRDDRSRSGRGRAAWPGSPISSRRTTRSSAPSCRRGPGSPKRFRRC